MTHRLSALFAYEILTCDAFDVIKVAWRRATLATNTVVVQIFVNPGNQDLGFALIFYPLKPR